MESESTIVNDNGIKIMNNRFKEMAIDLTSGSMGGIACAIAGQPMDTIKVKLQTSPNTYVNTLTCTRMLWKEGYIKPFFRGVMPAIASQIAENAILFLSYGQCCRCVAYVCSIKENELAVKQKALAGSLASFFSSLALCPLELIKCRLQVAGDSSVAGAKRISSASIIRDVVRQYGILGMYKGFTMTLAREMPGYFFLFAGYEGTRVLTLNMFPHLTATDTTVVLFAGGISGISFWGSMYPLDVIKTRQQVLSSSGTFIPFSSVLKTILAQQGFRGLYNGVAPCVLRAFPANAALFFGYETTKSLLSAL